MSCYSSCCSSGYESRQFFTKAEKIDMLKEYKKQLDLESNGISERISELESEQD